MFQIKPTLITFCFVKKKRKKKIDIDYVQKLCHLKSLQRKYSKYFTVKNAYLFFLYTREKSFSNFFFSPRSKIFRSWTLESFFFFSPPLPIVIFYESTIENKAWRNNSGELLVLGRAKLFEKKPRERSRLTRAFFPSHPNDNTKF